MTIQIQLYVGNNKDEQSFEMIEILCGTKPLNICVCSSTGNLVILTEHTLNIFKYTLASQIPSKTKYIDFQVRYLEIKVMAIFCVTIRTTQHMKNAFYVKYLSTQIILFFS